MKTIKLPLGVFLYDQNRPLGKRGGFGQVFEGKTAEGTEVAVKKLHVSAADAAHRELRIADELKGRTFEHVIPFIDAGEDADSGDYFVVMTKAEYSLQSFIDKNGALSTPQAASILSEIVKGLAEVGDLVHRDLKPDNVLFQNGKWKIADFGIARFIQDVTASNTLKECLSPHYAAPEQWRLERATHVTDVYALGCIAYCLINGNPPFVNNCSEEHQNARVPDFTCSDSRFRSLISMMLRKNPESRPTFSRIRELINEILEKSQIQSESDPLSVLAAAGAKVAERDQQREAEQMAALEEMNRRKRLAQSAKEILSENVERLWGKIHRTAPSAIRFQGYSFQIQLGDAVLTIDTQGSLVPQYSDHRSGWDFILMSYLEARQMQPEFLWRTSLCYAKAHNKQEYRWYEIGYFSPVQQEAYVTIAPHVRAADDALCPGRASVGCHIAYGPLLIDDESENEFHARIVWLLAKGSGGELRAPRRLPFTWPPSI